VSRSEQGAAPALAPSAGRAIFERLGRLGIDTVFVNSGTDFPPIIEGLAEGGAHECALPRAVLVSHEHAAMSMAHGAYLATGRAQAVILHTNVGLANGAISAINAATDEVPVLVLSGRTPAVERDRFGARTVPIGWGQEMRDQHALVREACKWDYELRYPEQVPTLLDRAYAIAMSTPKGPVYLSLPREVLSEPCPRSELEAPPAMQAAETRADPALLTRTAELLAGARRPVIVAQRGAGSDAGFAALARLADAWAIPVCQYWAVATAISARHPMYVGQDPGPWLSDADVVLVIDSLAPWSPDVHRLAPDCQVVQLGPDPLFSRFPVRNFRADLAIAGEVGPALVELEAALAGLDTGATVDVRAREARRASVAASTAARRERLTAEATAGARRPMTKEWVAHCLGGAIRGHRHTVISELGCPLDPLDLTEHGSWRQEPHSGGLGWGFPCALGMKLADPERLVVATMGDGSYLFANPVACHQVAEANDLPVLVVVVNNGAYGAVRRSVLDSYPYGFAAKEEEVPLTSLRPSPDFARVAEASRAHAATVLAGDVLPGAIDRALHAVLVERRPALLDVHVAA
jgi:acetolactate synthase-1/2/3 large subunit